MIRCHARRREVPANRSVRPRDQLMSACRPLSAWKPLPSFLGLSPVRCASVLLLGRCPEPPSPAGTGISSLMT
jgi:hypothetical protein